MYNLLPKIHKLRHIVRLTNATAIGISESKLNDQCLHQKVKSMSMTAVVVKEIDMEEDWLSISEMILVIMLNHISLKT